MVVAYDKKRAIGANGVLPWGLSLPADLAHFKKMTLETSVIMGRKTYESIGKALPNRENIVVSHRPLDAVDVIAVKSLKDAYNVAHGNIMIIGGQSIFEQALPDTDIIYATEVDEAFPEGDVFFPELDSAWQEMAREHHARDDKNAHDFDFVTYRRAR